MQNLHFTLLSHLFFFFIQQSLGALYVKTNNALPIITTNGTVLQPLLKKIKSIHCKKIILSYIPFKNI